MTQPHDALFRHVFGLPEHAAPLLRSCLPAALAAAIDWSTLQRGTEPQVDERQRRQELDILFSARLGDRRALLYLLTEHASDDVRLMPLKMLSYDVGLLKDHVRRHGDERLPIVIPIVIHCGRRPWRSPVEIFDLFDLEGLPDTVAQSVAATLPRFRYLVDDVWRCSEQDLRNRALSVLGLVAMASLQFLAPLRGDRGRVDLWLQSWGDAMRTAFAVVNTPAAQDAVEAVISYILRVTRLERSRLEITILKYTDEPTMKKFVSTYDLAIREGKTVGRAEGEVAGQARVLLHLLRRRFGEVPTGIEARMTKATPGELDRWAERVLDAATIDDVFAE